MRALTFQTVIIYTFIGAVILSGMLTLQWMRNVWKVVVLSVASSVVVVGNRLAQCTGHDVRQCAPAAASQQRTPWPATWFLSWFPQMWTAWQSTNWLSEDIRQQELQKFSIGIHTTMKKQVEKEEQMKLHFDTVEKERAAGMASVLTSLQRMGERLQDVVGELKGPGILRDLQDAVRGMEASLKADQQQLVEIRRDVVGLKSEVGGGHQELRNRHQELREGLGHIGDGLEALRTQGTPQLLTDVRTEVAELRAEKRSDQVADVIRALAAQLSVLKGLAARVDTLLAPPHDPSDLEVDLDRALHLDPSQWRQHTFSPPAPASFVQFSAYRAGARSFAVVGISLLSLSGATHLATRCRWMGGGGGAGLHGRSRTVAAGEHHDLQYQASTIVCHFSAEVAVGGYLVATINREERVVFVEKSNGSSMRPPAPLPRFLTICLAPTHGPLRMRLVREFVEYHLMIGVDRFVFYDAGLVDDRFHSVFAKEAGQGVVEVTDFRQQSQYPLWYYGQLLSIQDCIYRTRFTSRWTALADLDEYLWVRPPLTLPSLLHRYALLDGITHGSYWFAMNRCRPAADAAVEMNDTMGERSAEGGHKFTVERMVLRWPTPVCFHAGEPGYPVFDPHMCPLDTGHRKTIVNPRRVERLNVHGYIRSDPPDVYEPALELAHTDFIVHAHFQQLVDRSMETEECRALYPLGGDLEWWRADPEFARHLKWLRDGRRCQFQGPEQGVGEAGYVGVGGSGAGSGVT